MIDIGLNIRQATEQDRQKIASLIHYEPYVHRHLDWRTPLDWLGSPCFWVVEREERIIAALACPTDPDKVAWIRLFACSGEFPLDEMWRVLWKNAASELSLTTPLVPVIAMQNWLEALLRPEGFEYHQQIVMLEFNGVVPLTPNQPWNVIIRPMRREDLREVARVDAAAFAPVWQNSEEALERAFSLAGWATVAETSTGTIIGYQISTVNAFGAHLARLAVDPSAQGKGIGYALIVDLNHAISARGLRRISVNTQGDNAASLALYKKAGFTRTREEYPVFLYQF